MRVSNELGAGNPKSAAFSVVLVNLVSFIIAVIEAIVVLSLRHVISYAFTGGATVAKDVSDLDLSILDHHSYPQWGPTSIVW